MQIGQYLVSNAGNGCKFFALILQLSLLVAPNVSVANDKPLQSAFEVCSNLTNTEMDVGQSLTQAGWELSGNPEDTFRVFYSSHFAMQANENRLGYSVVNSGFMAASILGNSGLPPNQPTYSFGTSKLSTVGLTLDTPYCIILGDENLLTLLPKVENSETNSTASFQSISTFSDGGRKFYVANIDLEAAKVALDQSDPYEDSTKEDHVEASTQLLTILTPVSIVIMPESESK